MASDKALALLKEAKQLFDYGAFTSLQQAEFFKAMEAELGESLTPPPPSDVAPPSELMPLVAPAPGLKPLTEGSDLFESSATVGGTT